MDIKDVKLYRIIHIDNLDYILRLGKLTTYNSMEADPDYKGIGESELIGLRAEHTITTLNSGNTVNPSRDYLPFYLAPRSVMLYRIQTGHKVAKIEAKDIVYLVYRLSDILTDISYLFTDGHGYANITRWFDDTAFLHELDWEVINSTQWKNTEEDSDRQRRKQAEFWIEDEISLNKIQGIAVYNEETKAKVEAICKQNNKEIEIRIVKSYYY